MSTLIPYDLKVAEHGVDLGLKLRRLKGPAGARAVLLLHGGNTSGATYLVPHGGLAGYLHERGLDVWIMEWRSSPEVVGPLLDLRRPLGGSEASEREVYTLDRAVEADFPAALARMRRELDPVDPGTPISVLGHCLGAGALSIAIARGAIRPDYQVTHVVLSTLGLFVEVPWNGWIKAEDFILERIVHNDPSCRAIDPKSSATWPADFQAAYRRWPEAWLPGGVSAKETLLRNLTFMFGQPYSDERLHPDLRGERAAPYFGPMHLGLYQHVSQLVRRGFAARFNRGSGSGLHDQPDVIDRSRLHRARAGQPAVRGDLDPFWFRDLTVTLLAAGDSRLWHRDAVDLMYEWLRSNEPARPSSNYTKLVYPGYGLQELLWGEHAARQVFPDIAAALQRVPQALPMAAE